MPLPPIAIIGPGRLGRALAGALRHLGSPILGPFGRDWQASGLGAARVVLLTVPDAAIAEVAAALPPGFLVGHCAASVPLDALAPHERFSWHPLLAVPAEGVSFRAAACAVDASSPAGHEVALALAATLEMHAIHVDAGQRALYHAAASMAANYLVTLEGGAERLAAAVGLSRDDLAPLVRGAVEQWLARGATKALTGPIARGDRQTVAAQRQAVAEAAPDLLPLWDALAEATRALAGSPTPADTQC